MEIISYPLKVLKIQLLIKNLYERYFKKLGFKINFLPKTF